MNLIQNNEMSMQSFKRARRKEPNNRLVQMANKLGVFCKGGCRHWSAIAFCE